MIDENHTFAIPPAQRQRQKPTCFSSIWEEAPLPPPPPTSRVPRRQQRQRTTTREKLGRTSCCCATWEQHVQARTKLEEVRAVTQHGNNIYRRQQHARKYLARAVLGGESLPQLCPERLSFRLRLRHLYIQHTKNTKKTKYKSAVTMIQTTALSMPPVLLFPSYISYWCSNPICRLNVTTAPSHHITPHPIPSHPH